MNAVVLSLLAMSALAVAPASLAQTPTDAGAAAFRTCGSCHAVAPGEVLVGPSLAGVVGRRIASEPNFAYSTALKAKSGRWTRSALDGFIADPQGWAPGTTMGFVGLKDPARRAALLNYLERLK